MHKKTIIDFKQLGQRLIFTNPIKELKTRRLDQVEELLTEIESWQEKGYYAVGYVSYEASPAFEEKFQVHSAPLQKEYLLYFTIHDKAEQASIPLTYEEVEMPVAWQGLTSEQEYRKAIETIHHHIRQGDTYQVNYTVQLCAELNPEDSLAIYNRLVVEQNAAYNAYVEHDETTILSISPELFFEEHRGQLTTRPMKGTTNRGLTLEQDREQAAWLTQDAKNRAENMMIVDLLRNDMNRISRTGSERVERLCSVEQYSTVWQMTSTIKSQLQEGIGLAELFKALFPCGSITGAPKISTMAIIKATEKAARGVYCGTVGICLPDQRRIFNVAIRTIQLEGKKAIYGVGGGITWDSTWKSEYIETQQKSAVLYRKNPRFDLISTGKVTDGQLTLQDKHLQRLAEAASYFAYPFDQSKLEQELEESCAQLDKGQDYRLRIALKKDGSIELETAPLLPLTETFRKAKLVEQTANLDQPFTYFKTSHRPHLTLEQQEQIYYNVQDQLLETSIGNLLLELDGKLYTPPAELGLLKGIYSQQLIDEGKATEKVLTLTDLAKADKIYACNAVRGLYELELDSKPPM
ncbi:MULTISPECIES: aminodeoxychorismate synthase component I [Streptococcus]|uniref:aminodeoxychorismate synthase component I n=1 Tax=Streptococcus TaxID=1301 RepID=UPI000F682E6C|nr:MULTISPECIES: aminodeoxychorismate synthase component I [Streptococcus]MBS6244653.1 aminodeoxychorismate synthase component I [Streptococcus sp.]RSJ44295.1 Aminodeoxychorismate synthase component 1 [Streptococcus gordonii]RSJ47260.1 Aminodeoxychorismate synthase component 1 [Streptococcus gordonii]RSJ51942.1 Aminodeoxychorismate synthase component 1 [Streptococcus gordonii]